MDILCSVHDIDDNRSFSMSDFNWCHGPECHKEKTTDRVRGVKGSKVLRTRKIKLNNWNKDWWTKYFCDQTCMHDFITRHIEQFVQLHPRTEALETPIEDPVKIQHAYGWISTEIKEVDNNSNP